MRLDVAVPALQIRDMPPDVHRALKARAAAEGLSLSAYALRELTRVAETPTLAELVERVEAMPPLAPNVTTAEIVEVFREMRGT